MWHITIPVALAQTPTQNFINYVTDELIIPKLEKSVSHTKALQEQSKLFCDNPAMSDFTALQQKWKNSMHSWSALALFRFGPMIDNNIDLKIFYLPIRKIQIKNNILSIPDDADQLPVSARGLASLEYLIFDPKQSIPELQAGFGSDPNQCRYLQLLTNQLVVDQINLLNAWRNDFAPLFKGIDHGITEHEALSEIVTSTIRYLEYSIKNRLSRPAGINQSNPLPYKVESWRSRESINNLLAGIDSVENLLGTISHEENATRDTGLATLLNKQGQTEIAQSLIQQTTQLKASLMSIEPSLFIAVTDSQQRVQAVIKNYQQLTDHIKTDVATILDIQIGFNDDDGD